MSITTTRPKYLKTYHNEPLFGHRDIIETNRKIREIYFLKNITGDINNYVNSCELCQYTIYNYVNNKIQRKSFKAPMVLTSYSLQPFQRVSIDSKSYYSVFTDNNNKYILTLQNKQLGHSSQPHCPERSL